jgi:hypothetical protein
MVIFKFINHEDHANARHHQAQGHPDAELHMSLPQTIEAIVRLAHTCKRTGGGPRGLLSDFMRAFLIEDVLPHAHRLDPDDFRATVWCARALVPVLSATRGTIGKWHAATNHSNRTSSSNMQVRDFFAVLDGAKLVDRCARLGICMRVTQGVTLPIPCRHLSVLKASEIFLQCCMADDDGRDTGSEARLPLPPAQCV